MSEAYMQTHGGRTAYLRGRNPGPQTLLGKGNGKGPATDINSKINPKATKQFLSANKTKPYLL